MNKIKRLFITLFIAGQFTISSCIFINEVDQPTTADVGEKISIVVEVENHFGGWGGYVSSSGIAAIMMPTDWTIESVEYDGDVYSREMVFLHPDSVDLVPFDPIALGGGTDYWTDSLQYHYPPGDGMDWYVYESAELEAWVGDTVITFVTFELTTGAAGTYDLAFYFNSSDFNFGDTTYIGPIDSANTITVIDPSVIENIQSGVAKEFALKQNFPNPFNPTTKIQYEIKNSSQVNLTVYDLTGKEVAILVNSFQNAGIHEVNFDAANLPSGIYIYKLNAGSFSEMRKMALVK